MSESVLAKSIVGWRLECYKCERTNVRLERHHIFNGNPNRRLSEKYGAWVYLCPECHREVHANIDARLALKAEAQKAVMEAEGWTVEDFRSVFGKNYL